jgi:hypothetical protein
VAWHQHGIKAAAGDPGKRLSRCLDGTKMV